MTSIVIHLPEGALIGKGRPRLGKGHTYTPDKTRRAETSIGLAANKVMAGKALFTGPVALSVWMAITPPKSWTKKEKREAIAGIHATGKPDLDNVVKLVGDALNNIVWADDSQITSIRITRRYMAEGFSTIRVATATEAEESGDWIARKLRSAA